MTLEQVPNEVWTAILKRMKEVGDWGQLQQVSRAFNAIVQDHCWTQAKQLLLRVDQLGVYLMVTGKRLWLSDANLVLLAEELAKKATKIQTVYLHIYWDLYPFPEDAVGLVLSRLASASLKVKELNIGMYSVYAFGLLQSFARDLLFASRFHPLADFINSISGTLEGLKCSIDSDLVIGPELQQAFRHCRALKTISVNVKDPAMVESILFGKTQLQMVRMYGWVVEAPLPASAWLNTGAPLTSCYFGGGQRSHDFVFQEYSRAVQEQNLVDDHPLKSLKTLSFTTHSGALTPFHLFPHLEQLDMGLRFTIQIDYGALNAVIDQFLGHYRHAPGNRRALNIQMCVYISSNQPLPPLAAILAQMTNPVASAEQKDQHTRELTFNRGNATAKAIIKRRQL